MNLSESKIHEEINNIPLVDDDPQIIVQDDNDSSLDSEGYQRDTTEESIGDSPTHNYFNSDNSPDELEEKARLITQVLELQNTLDDLSHRVDNVKDETVKLRSENQVLGQYIENLMAASSVFQSTSPKAKKK